MQRDGNVSAALFSLLWPGLGHLAQGRLFTGLLFVCWTAIGAAVVAFGELSLGIRLAIAGEVAIVAVWAIIDAYRGVAPLEDSAMSQQA